MKKLSKIYRKSLLYKSRVEYANFCLNHIGGCSHGCTYPCYAMKLSMRYGRIKDYQDWLKPKIVVNALELLDKEIPKYKHEIESVFLCFTTDPFMYNQPEVVDMTLKIIARLHRDNIRCVTLTKGIYPKDLLDKKTYGNDNDYGITLVSLDEGFQQRFEPYSALFVKRIEGLRMLHDAGLKTWVSMEPYPTPNLVKQDLDSILSKISFVDRIVFGRWNYNKQIAQYEDNDKFYVSCVGKVEFFCKRKGISCYIKQGTIK